MRLFSRNHKPPEQAVITPLMRPPLIIEGHDVRPEIPLYGLMTPCLLNALIELLPNHGRVVTFTSRSAGDSLHEKLTFTYGTVSLEIDIIDVYINWAIKHDLARTPSASDNDLVALSVSGKLVDTLGRVINEHITRS